MHAQRFSSAPFRAGIIGTNAIENFVCVIKSPKKELASKSWVLRGIRRHFARQQ